MAPAASGGALSSVPLVAAAGAAGGATAVAAGAAGTAAWGGAGRGAPGWTRAGSAGAGRFLAALSLLRAGASALLLGLASSQGASFAGSVFCTQAAGTKARAHKHEATIRRRRAPGHETANRCNREMLTGPASKAAG